jgi:hypothetical protein
MKDDVLLDCMSREEAEQQLRALINGWTNDERKKQVQLDGVAYSIEWYVTTGRLSESQVRERAVELAKAAKEFSIELKRSEPFWRFMMHYAPLRESEWFGRTERIPWLPSFEDTSMGAASVEAAAAKVASVLHRSARGPDEYDRTLGIGLAGAYLALSGEPPGSSNSGHPNDPRSHLGNFVRLALLASPHSDSERIQQLLRTLPSFIKRTKKFFEKSPLRDVMGDEPRQ